VIAVVSSTGQTANVDEAFVSLVCADRYWLRKEFDEIVAANFDNRPPRRHPMSAARARQPLRWHTFVPAPDVRYMSGTALLPSRRQVRERSPPDCWIFT
jgi:hypothetical protein